MEPNGELIDLLVIGGGTAGLVGATMAARLGARTVLVESARTGGDCLWTGCIPSKTILAAARQSQSERTLTGTGTPFAAVRTRISAAITAIEPDDSPAALEAAGVTVLAGAARFTGPGRAEVDGRGIRFRQALIATGSAPFIPPIPGLETAPVVTSETVWDLEELPDRLVVIGGGPIGCELGQAYARLGSEVVILARSTLLRKEDRDAAGLVRDSLRSDGVVVLENTGVERVSRENGTALVHTVDGQSYPADVILVATGRTPRTAGLGLDSVGVKCDSSGYVLVDRAMRTSVREIWAAGDVTPYPDYTHLAGVYANTAVTNAVLGLRRTVSDVIPRVTFTSPELAAVGVTRATAPGHSTTTIQHAHTDRAITEEGTTGFARIVVDKRGRILGGTLVGPRAGESLGELTLAVHKKLTTRNLAEVTHPYPTYNDALWNAAITDAVARLQSPIWTVAITALTKSTRWRTDRAARRSGR